MLTKNVLDRATETLGPYMIWFSSRFRRWMVPGPGGLRASRGPNGAANTFTMYWHVLWYVLWYVFVEWIESIPACIQY